MGDNTHTFGLSVLFEILQTFLRGFGPKFLHCNIANVHN